VLGDQLGQVAAVAYAGQRVVGRQVLEQVAVVERAVDRRELVDEQPEWSERPPQRITATSASVAASARGR